MSSSGNKMCLSKLCLGLAFGLTFGLEMMLFAWAGWYWGYGVALISQLSFIYPGFAPTFMGGLWGGLWGFVGGFVIGFVIALFYNLGLCCCRCDKK